MDEFDNNDSMLFQDDEEFQMAFGDDNSPDGRKRSDQDSNSPREIADETG